MSNLENFNNVYANLSESAYNGRPMSISHESLKNNQKSILDSGQPLQFNYSDNALDKKGKVLVRGGRNLPNDGVVYLQPDKTLHTEKVQTNLQVPNPNGGNHTESYVTSTYQKGVLTDEKAGFNAYFVTDTPKLNNETKETYLAVRGSDSFGLDTLNDWVENDGNFALRNAYIPQAKLANQALISKIKEIKAQAPNAKLNVTGHSLGTIVSAQAVAKRYQEHPKDFETIGKVVLFDGPDVTQSLKNMGLSDKEIKAAGEKVTYYINPFDMVSMLNRTAPYDKQFGQVNVIVPVHFSTSLDEMSSHDFGEFQMDANGNPLSASKNFHPEMLTAGHQLANLIETTLSKVKTEGINGISSTVLLGALSQGIPALMALGMTAVQAKAIYDNFNKNYSKIISDAKKEAKAWNTEHIPDYQNRIRSASGSQKVELRLELLQSVAQDAMIRSEEFTTEIKNDLSEALEKVQKEIMTGVQAAHNVAHHLDMWEVSRLLSEFTISHFWDTGIEEQTNKAARNYQTDIEKFSATLMKIGQNIEQVDSQGASEFNQLMRQTNANWGVKK